tara:strand:+ start:254 stop:445 length:192 start_codon:yes stop_codon:yes gene_type:complete
MIHTSESLKAQDGKEVIRLLEKGIQADIWYDAHDLEDEEARQVIEDVQGAMQEAISLLKDGEL